MPCTDVVAFRRSVVEPCTEGYESASCQAAVVEAAGRYGSECLDAPEFLGGPPLRLYVCPGAGSESATPELAELCGPGVSRGRTAGTPSALVASTPAASAPQWSTRDMLVNTSVTAALVGGAVGLGTRHRFKKPDRMFKGVDFGEIGTGPSIYDSVWARR